MAGCGAATERREVENRILRGGLRWHASAAQRHRCADQRDARAATNRCSSAWRHEDPPENPASTARNLRARPRVMKHPAKLLRQRAGVIPVVRHDREDEPPLFSVVFTRRVRRPEACPRRSETARRIDWRRDSSAARSYLNGSDAYDSATRRATRSPIASDEVSP